MILDFQATSNCSSFFQWKATIFPKSFHSYWHLYYFEIHICENSSCPRNVWGALASSPYNQFHLHCLERLVILLQTNWESGKSWRKCERPRSNETASLICLTTQSLLVCFFLPDTANAIFSVHPQKISTLCDPTKKKETHGGRQALASSLQPHQFHQPAKARLFQLLWRTAGKWTATHWKVSGQTKTYWLLSDLDLYRRKQIHSTLLYKIIQENKEYVDSMHWIMKMLTLMLDVKVQIWYWDECLVYYSCAP